jgi:hypothetical protein
MPGTDIYKFPESETKLPQKYCNTVPGMSTAGGKVGIKEEDEVDSELGHQQEK